MGNAYWQILELYAYSFLLSANTAIIGGIRWWFFLIVIFHLFSFFYRLAGAALHWGWCSPAQTIHKFIPQSGGTKIINYFFLDNPFLFLVGIFCWIIWQMIKNNYNCKNIYFITTILWHQHQMVSELLPKMFKK